MNLEKLDEAIAYIEAHPEEHDQGTWFARGGCGTTACLAGTVAVLDGWTPVWRSDRSGEARDVEKDGVIRYVGGVATDVLGIDDDGDERDYLFFCAADLDDIKRFRREYAAGTWEHPEREW